ncbi:MAG TPA: gluconeogenesis factor YvcK family protein [Patescibacteria group bacterium]
MKRKKIVTIGGGTGSFTLLSGLKKYPVDITAIVSMADDGGSTGVLRDELGVLPPGDVRQCLVALSDSSETLRELMNYRFEEGGLKGHSFGNLLLSALEKTSGGFSKGVREAIKILNVKGEVIPVTNQDARLCVKVGNKKILVGQANIDTYAIQKNSKFTLGYSSVVKANPLALKRIAEADVIIIGPGNHYSSIVPNFLVKGISEAIRKSKATVIYNCNLVNKEGHTENFDLDDYVDAMNKYLGSERIDFVTFNMKQPNKILVEKYKMQRELIVRFDRDKRTDRHCRIVCADLLRNKGIAQKKGDTLIKRSLIRHDSDKLAKVLMLILELGEYENIIKEII